MIINGRDLRALAPIDKMAFCKVNAHGVSYGLGEAGYDIRVKQTVLFKADGWGSGTGRTVATTWTDENGVQMGACNPGRFTLASTIEHFDMPDNLTGVVHDKSTWARKGLSVFNTVIEPGWKGFLTLELVYHGEEDLIIPAGAGIAQVLFHQNSRPAEYRGKYQNQEDQPVPARSSS